MKPDINRKSRFFPTPPAFDAFIRGSLRRNIGIHGKTRMVWLPDVKNCWEYVYSFRQNTRTWRTDTQEDTARRHRPRLYIHSIARKKQTRTRPKEISRLLSPWRRNKRRTPQTVHAIFADSQSSMLWLPSRTVCSAISVELYCDWCDNQARPSTLQ